MRRCVPFLRLLAPGLIASGLWAQGTSSFTTTPASLSFRFQVGTATLPSAQTMQINSTPAGLSYTIAVTGSPFSAAWLLPSTTSGKAPGSLRVQVNPNGLPVGTYSATITITGTTGGPPPTKTVAVSLVVTSGPPTISASPGVLSFNYTTGGAIPSPSLTTSFILSSNGIPVSATITAPGAAWLKVLPTGDITLVGLLNTIAVTVDPTGLVPKVYTASITISAPAATNKTLAVTVTLTVNAAPPRTTAVWPSGLSQGAPQTIVSLLGSNFFSTSTVAATGFTTAATITVTDSAAGTAVETLSLPIYSSSASVLRLTMASPFPSGTVAAAYSQNLTAAGGAGPYTWAVTGGSLPPGLLVAGAQITGTPTTPGTYSFTLTATDSATPNAAHAYEDFRITIDPAGSATLRVTLAAAVLPSGAVGTAYSQTLTAAGGTAPYTFSAVGLPAGLSLSAGGVLSGTPTSVGFTGPLSASFVSDSALLVTIPGTFLVAEGTLRIAVTTPAPGGGASNDAQLPVFGPEPQITAVVNSASFQQGTIAPGEIITIFGFNLGPATFALFDPTLPTITTSLPAGGTATSVTIGGTAAPIVYTSLTQIAVIAPFTLAGVSAQVVVAFGTLSSLPFTVAVAPTNTGVYTLDSSGSGQGAILNFNATTSDFTVNSNAAPALKGSTVVMYITGAGSTTPVVSNTLIPAAPAVVPNATPTVQIGGQSASVTAAQAPVGSIPGLIQLNVTVPNAAPAGSAVPVLVTVGGVDSQAGVTMAVK